MKAETVKDQTIDQCMVVGEGGYPVDKAYSG